MPMWLIDLWHSLSERSTDSRAHPGAGAEPMPKTDEQYKVKMATVDAEQAALAARREAALKRITAAQNKYDAYEKPNKRRAAHA